MRTLSKTMINKVKNASNSSNGKLKIPPTKRRFHQKIAKHLKHQKPTHKQKRVHFVDARKSIHNYSYIPPTEVPQLYRRNIVIDGCNVAYNHGHHRMFSIVGLETSLEFFYREGFVARAIVPEMRINHNHTTDRKKLIDLHEKGWIVFTPCKDLPQGRCISYDDRFILEIAAKLDGVVISNDNFRDLLDIDDDWDIVIRSRVVGFTFCDHLFMLPKDPYGPNGPTLYEIFCKNVAN